MGESVGLSSPDDHLNYVYMNGSVTPKLREHQT